MQLTRRDFAASATAGAASFGVGSVGAMRVGSGAMYGVISEFLTVLGKRDEFIAILAQATRAMPGCLAYVIAKDASRDDAVWVTEIWADPQSHAASLALPAVQAALKQGRPLIAGMGVRAETVPVAGA